MPTRRTARPRGKTGGPGPAAEAFFRERFAAGADASRAAAQQAYMKSTLSFYGVTSADVRGAARDFVRLHPELDGRDLERLSRHLFATDSFDLRSACVAVLERRADRLAEPDLQWVVDLVRLASCWAHVDWLAAKVVGGVLRGDTAATRRWLVRWAKDPHLWVRRTALLAQNDELRAGRGDFALFARIAVPMLPEESFWIRKALGWVLREVSKKRPELTAAFLREHGTDCSGLTRREASKYVPQRLLTGSG